MILDQDAGRLEYQWLRDCREWLQPDGLLVYVVPQKILGYSRIARYLVTWLSGVRLLRFRMKSIRYLSKSSSSAAAGRELNDRNQTRFSRFGIWAIWAGVDTYALARQAIVLSAQAH